MRRNHPCLALTMTLMFLPPVHAATVGVAELGPGDLIVTEYLADPIGVSDANGEYFEIFNTRMDTVDLTGLVIRDDGSNSFEVAGLSAPPRSFVVFSNGDGQALGFTPDYSYGGAMSLTNTDDEIGLFGPGDTLINKAVYTDGDFFGDGMAHELASLAAGRGGITTGPAAGTDFIAAVGPLLLGNAGSPGSAGQTNIALVPVPASAWLFLSGLGLASWMRRRLSRE